jgi:hypothetical protein
MVSIPGIDQRHRNRPCGTIGWTEAAVSPSKMVALSRRRFDHPERYVQRRTVAGLVISEATGRSHASNP